MAKKMKTEQVVTQNKRWVNTQGFRVEVIVDGSVVVFAPYEVKELPYVSSKYIREVL